jgi:UDPglucose 6-dehydrogenase
VALLGLAYKPGTDTLRRSASLELGRRLAQGGAEVRAFDPAIATLPADVREISLAASLEEALRGAEVAVVATAWPAFATLSGDQLVAWMQRPQVVDAAGCLGGLADDPRITYLRVGRPVPRVAAR